MSIKNNRDKLLAMFSLKGEDGLRTILDHRKAIVSNINFDQKLSSEQVKMLTSPNGLYKLGIYEDIFAKEEDSEKIDEDSHLYEDGELDLEGLSLVDLSLELEDMSDEEKFAQVDRIIAQRDPSKSEKDRLALYHLVVEMVSLGSTDKLNKDIKELLLDFMHQLDSMVPFSKVDLAVINNYTSFIAKALEQTDTYDSKAYLSLMLAINSSVNAANRKKKIYDKIARVCYYAAISSLGVGILAVFTPLLPSHSGVVIFSMGFVLGVQGYLKANSLSSKHFSEFQDELQQINISLVGGEVADKVVAAQEKLLAYVKEHDGICPTIESASVLAEMKGDRTGSFEVGGNYAIPVHSNGFDKLNISFESNKEFDNSQDTHHDITSSNKVKRS